MRKQDVLNTIRLELQETTRAHVSQHAAVVELADRCGITPQAVYKWPDDLDFQRQCIVEVVTKGKFVADRSDATRINRMSESQVRRAQRVREIRERLGLA